MSSYAEIASHGPKQTDAEKIPPHVPEILHDDASVHSLNTEGSISIDHPSQPPSYADQQRQAEEAEARVQATASKAKADAQEFGRQAESKAAQLERDGKQAYNSAKKEVKKDYNEAKKQVNAGAERVKKDAKKAEQWAEDNKGNPVVIGNVVVVGALAGLIGIGAYRKYIAGELTWKVAGTWAGVVGLFAAGDYLVSSWLFKNRYPPKN